MALYRLKHKAGVALTGRKSRYAYSKKAVEHYMKTEFTKEQQEYLFIEKYDYKSDKWTPISPGKVTG